MKLPLNEWAVAEWKTPILADKAWNEFVELVNELTEKSCCQKILVPVSFASTLNREIFALDSMVVKMRYKSFVDKRVERCCDELPNDRYICQGESGYNPSILLTIANNEKLPVVSITFTDEYRCDSLEAYSFSGLGKGRLVTIHNLYFGNRDSYWDELSIGRPGRDVNPAVNPIWDKEGTKAYVDSLIDLTEVEPGEKKAHLLIEGRRIARLNGWVEDKKLSTINSGPDRMRHVFRPAKFRHCDSAFLSIDFEKRAFELHDYKGRHLGEYSYLGEERHGREANHDIKLHR